MRWLGRTAWEAVRLTPDEAEFGGRPPVFCRVFGEVTPARRPRCWSSTSQSDAQRLSRQVMPVYDEFSKTGLCGTMPRTKAVSNSAIEVNSSVRK